MNRAHFEIGREPTRPDPLRQVPVNDATVADPRDIDRIRRGLAASIAFRNQRDAARPARHAEAR